MAKTRHLSVNRLLVELIESGIEAKGRRQDEFSISPRASGPPAIRKKSNDSGTCWAAWFSAIDAEGRELE